MSKHTPEPWSAERGLTNVEESVGKAWGGIADSEGFVIADVWNDASVLDGEANAARIVATVNACKDIPNPEAIPELIEALRDLEWTARDDWFGAPVGWPSRERVEALFAKAGLKRARC